MTVLARFVLVGSRFLGYPAGFDGRADRAAYHRVFPRCAFMGDTCVFYATTSRLVTTGGLMNTTTCPTGDRSSQRASALERDIAELRGEWEAWRAQLGVWQSYTPPLDVYSNNQRIPVNMGTGGVRQGFYIRVGSRLHLRMVFYWGQPPYDAGLSMSLCMSGLVEVGVEPV
ncbi:hypothetical protein, partial [Saccharopolyspora tripterygii]